MNKRKHGLTMEEGKTRMRYIMGILGVVIIILGIVVTVVFFDAILAAFTSFLALLGIVL